MRSLIHPKRSETEQLKNIWCEGFPADAEGYCDFYFEKHFRPDRCLAVFNGIELESAVHMFDGYYRGKDEKRYDFFYLYAGATLKKYRGKKNLEYMIEGCMKYAYDCGKYGIVVSAAEDIVYLYDRWGYRRMADVYTYSLIGEPLKNGITWQASSFDKYMRLRTEYLDQISSRFYWNEESEKYQYEDICTRGRILTCIYEGKEYFAVCADEEECLMIRETSFPLMHMDLLVDSICGNCSYAGRVTICTKEAEFFSRREIETEKIYSGHFGLCRDFEGSKLLTEAYFSLVGD